MRKTLSGGSRWVWVFVLALIGLLILGLAILPEVFRRGGLLSSIPLNNPAAPVMPVGYYILTLFTLALFAGVVISLVIERFERPMLILFVTFRLAAVAWQYQLGRHSLWYLTGSVAAHLLVGGLVLLFFSGRMRLPPGEIGPDEDIP